MKNGKLETHEIVGFILSKGWLSVYNLQRALGSYGIIKTDESVRKLRRRYEYKYIQSKCVKRCEEKRGGKVFYATLYFGNHFEPTLEQIKAFESEFNKHFPEVAPQEKRYHKVWDWFIGLSS